MKKMFLAVAVFALVMLPMAGMADTCYVEVTGTDLNSSRSSNVDIVGTEAWNVAGNFIVAWNVTGGNGNPFNYKYTITSLGVAPPDQKPGDMSHFILQVSDGFTFYSGPTGDFGDYEGPKFWGPGDQGNPGIPGNVYGIKFDETDPVNGVTVIEFKSFNRPVWGDFYAKGPNNPDTYAYNAFFGTSACDTAGDYSGFICVPDSVVVPIPGSLLLLGSGILGLVGLRRKLF